MQSCIGIILKTTKRSQQFDCNVAKEVMANKLQQMLLIAVYLVWKDQSGDTDLFFFVFSRLNIR